MPMLAHIAINATHILQSGQWIRFYDPEKALFNKSWTMPDIEQMK